MAPRLHRRWASLSLPSLPPFYVRENIAYEKAQPQVSNRIGMGPAKPADEACVPRCSGIRPCGAGKDELQRDLKGEKAAKGSYFPLLAAQRYDPAGQYGGTLENGVFLGHVANLVFSGPQHYTPKVASPPGVRARTHTLTHTCCNA